MDVIDISGWGIDEAFYPYPEGSRNKYAPIAPEDGCTPAIIPGHRYLMKFSNQRYPVQFWSEVISGIIGNHIAFQHPERSLPSTLTPENPVP